MDIKMWLERVPVTYCFIEHLLKHIQGFFGAGSRHCGHRVQSSSAMKAYQKAQSSRKKQRRAQKGEPDTVIYK